MIHVDGKQSFWIPFTLPSLNEVIGENRNNKYSGAKLKRQIQDDICNLIMQDLASHQLQPVTDPVEIEIVWYEKDNRRDIDNIQSAKKFILDALVEMKVIPNDNRRWVSQIHDHVYTAADPDDAGVLVYIENE